MFVLNLCFKIFSFQELSQVLKSKRTDSGYCIFESIIKHPLYHRHLSDTVARCFFSCADDYRSGSNGGNESVVTRQAS